MGGCDGKSFQLSHVGVNIEVYVSQWVVGAGRPKLLNFCSHFALQTLGYQEEKILETKVSRHTSGVQITPRRQQYLVEVAGSVYCNALASRCVDTVAWPIRICQAILPHLPDIILRSEADLVYCPIGGNGEK